jgi:hypothetical protein
MRPIHCLIALGLVASACRSSEHASAPVSPPPATTPPAPVVAQTPPTSSDPLQRVPASDTVLSVLEPVDRGCQWVRRDPVAKKETPIVVLPTACTAELRISPDGHRALIGDDTALWLVDVIAGSLKKLPELPTGHAVRFGFLPNGTAYGALTEDVVGEERIQPTGTVFLGQTYRWDDAEDDGTRQLAHAYKLTPASQWEHWLTRATTSGTENAKDIEIFKGLIPGWSTEAGMPATQPLPAGDLGQKLDAAAPTIEDGHHWVQLAVQPPVAYARMIDEDGEAPEDSTHLNGVFLWDGQKLTAVETRDGAGIESSGQYVLARSPPKLFGLKPIALVYTGPDGAKAAFWPKAAALKSEK